MNDLKTFNLTDFKDHLIIHFGVDTHVISAETLAHSLLGISNSLRIVDSSLNTGYKIELIIEATGEGSFKVVAKTIRKSLNNLFSKQNINGLTIGLLTSAIWYWVVPPDEIKITINTNEYVLEGGKEKIVLPRAAETYFDSIKRNEILKKEVAETFKTINRDEKITSIEFTAMTAKMSLA